MSQIPLGWARTPLAELLDKSIGGVWGEPDGTADVRVSVIRVTELKPNGGLDTSTAAVRSITVKQFESRQLREGDLLLEKSGGGPTSPVGRVALIDKPLDSTICSNFMQLMRPRHDVVLPRYLHLYLTYFQLTGGTVPLQTATTNIRNIRMTDYMASEIPVPPYDEQRRIVAVLEEHISRIGAAEKSLHAVEVMERSLARASQRDACQCVPTIQAPLRTVVSRIEAGKSFTCIPRPSLDDEWGIVRVSALTWGAFRPRENKTVPSGREVDTRHQIHKGDILVSRANTVEYVGAPVFVTEEPPRLLLSDKSLRIVPSQGVDPRWLITVLRSPSTRAQISQLATGTKDSMRNISQANLLSIMIPVPINSSDQDEVVRVADAMAQGSEHLSASVEVAISRARALRNSLLSAAFTGNLPTNHLEQMNA
ncbi:MAG: restriction endonuclease subunit S [Actinomycetota bacterium]|nr:restriction endonuclease subunit S [Actinomycetota bacterium]